jgi:hypothetical protein
MRETDRDLDEMGDLVAEMKRHALVMNAEIDKSNTRIKKINNMTDRTEEHVKRNTSLCVKYT